MISKSSVEKVFSSPISDYTSVKTDSEAVLYGALEDMEINYKFKTKPRFNQLVAFLIANLEASFLFYYDMGTGKTKAVLDIIAYKKEQQQVKKSLFLVAGPSAVLDIASQVPVHTDLTVLPLQGNGKNKWEQLKNEAGDVVVLNYQGLFVMCCSLVRVKKGKKKQYVVDVERLAEFRSHFDLIIFDEIFMLQNHRSTTYKICEYLSREITYRYGLTGTPAGKSPEALWTQFFLMDRGYTLGRNITTFRQHFFTTKRNYWGGYVHTFIKSKQAELKKRMANKSLTYTIKELGEILPKQNFQAVPLELPPESKSLYEEILAHTASEFLNGTEIEHAYAKLRQLCSGFIQFYPEDSEKKTIVRLDNNQKLDALVNLLENMPKDCKALVYYEYIESGKILEERLKKEKIQYLRLDNNVDTFTKSKKYKVMLLQNRSGATSLNLQAASFVFFYESILCPALRKQQEARVYRIGQVKPCFYYSFVTHGTVEVQIQESLKEGKKLSAALFFQGEGAL